MTSTELLARVTITGADDIVAWYDLFVLSKEFPFVEWAILVSKKREGTPRYPNAKWCDIFFWGAANVSTRVAVHLCGEAARDVLAGRDFGWKWPLPRFISRVQLNGWDPATDVAATEVLLAADDQREFILQVRDSAGLSAVQALAQKHRNVSALWDPSGGRGVETKEWPSGERIRLGYAGGITPDNVERVLSEVRPSEPFWIDMESGVRTDNRLDLGKVRKVLERCKPFTQ